MSQLRDALERAREPFRAMWRDGAVSDAHLELRFPPRAASGQVLSAAKPERYRPTRERCYGFTVARIVSAARPRSTEWATS